MKKYVANFEPQAWINDNAVKVDAQGETSWDCTEFIQMNPDFLNEKYKRELSEYGYFVDEDDVLKNDSAAPEWVREWEGPFTISVELWEES